LPHAYFPKQDYVDCDNDDFPLGHDLQSFSIWYHYLMSSPSSLGDVSPRSHLKLGASARINGIDISLKGFVRCSASDDEETWYWEEWFAGEVAGDELWLEFDEESETYTLFRKLSTETVVTPQPWSTGQHVQLSSGEQIKIKEVAAATVIEAKGSLPEGHTRGSNFLYYDTTQLNGHPYTIETSDEVEIFKGDVLKPLALFKAMNMTGAISKYEWRKSQRELWKFARLICLGVALLGALAFGVFSQRGTRVLNENFTTCPTRAVPCPAEQRLLGPVTLSKVNRAHRLNIKAPYGISQTNWQAITVTLLDESKQPISAVEGDFWEEAWKEGGESGIDRNTSKEKYFRLSKAGTYYLQVTAEPVNLTSGPTNLTIQLYEDVMYWPYFIGLILGGLGIVGIKDNWLRYLDD
jgi:hypothetical protein